ncbi:MAG: LamG-like jellyroll fold domain-containing protein [Terrimicrobiaceae bacterium]
MKLVYSLFPCTLLAFCVLAPASPAADVIAHYTFDKDFSAAGGATGPLNAEGDAAISNSEFVFGGGALLLDGDKDYAWSPDPGFRMNQEDFALSFWYRRNRAEDIFEPLAGWGNSVANNGYAVRLIKSAIKSERGVVEGLLNDNAEKSVTATQPDNQDSAFQHVVLQRKEGVLELYLNGEPADSEPGVGEWDLAENEKRAGFRFAFDIGACNTHEDGTGTVGAFSGLIDEVWVFNAALSPAEIKALKEKNEFPK